jgi:hypothetical protein
MSASGPKARFLIELEHMYAENGLRTGVIVEYESPVFTKDDEDGAEGRRG